MVANKNNHSSVAILQYDGCLLVADSYGIHFRGNDYPVLISQRWHSAGVFSVIATSITHCHRRTNKRSDRMEWNFTTDLTRLNFPPCRPYARSRIPVAVFRKCWNPTSWWPDAIGTILAGALQQPEYPRPNCERLSEAGSNHRESCERRWDAGTLDVEEPWRGASHRGYARGSLGQLPRRLLLAHQEARRARLQFGVLAEPSRFPGKVSQGERLPFVHIQISSFFKEPGSV